MAWWWPSGDYRRKNVVTKQDICTLTPHGGPVGQADQYVSLQQLDLHKGYSQFPVAQQDFPKMAVIPPFGLLEFLLGCRMRDSLSNVSLTS